MLGPLLLGWVGAYQHKTLSPAFEKIFNDTQSHASNYMQRMGLNGFVSSTLDEVWVKIVNGRSIVFKADNTCLRVYQTWEGSVTFEDAFPCSDVSEAFVR